MPRRPGPRNHRHTVATWAAALLSMAPAATSQVVDISVCTASRRFDNPDPHPPVRCAITNVPGPSHNPVCATQDRFGSSFAVGGDFDGNGAPVLVIGGSCDSQAVAQSTQAWLYLSSSGVPDITLDGDGQTDLFGSALCFIPDLDGDGRDELAVGAPTASDSGRVFLFFGQDPDEYTAGERRPALAHADVVIQGAVNAGRFGACLTTGDVDGDGSSDLIVGAPGSVSSDAAGFAGSVAWFSGAELAADRNIRNSDAANGEDASGDAGSHLRLLLASRARRTWHGLLAADRFGHSLAAVGELDGSPGVEIFAGAPQIDSEASPLNPTGSGYAVVLTGSAVEPIRRLGPLIAVNSPDDGTAGSVADDPSTLPLQFGEAFGFAVASGRDLDGDGVPDLIVGAPHYSATADPDDKATFRDNGRVWFLSGASGRTFFIDESKQTGDTERMAPPRDLSLASTSQLGCSLAFVDDSTGDGHPDLLVGAFRETTLATRCPWNPSQLAGGDESGAVHVVDGNTGNVVTRIIGEGGNDHLGQAIAGHDMDGDGLAEIFCSAASWSQGQNRPSRHQQGRAYMMHGAHVSRR